MHIPFEKANAHTVLAIGLLAIGTLRSTTFSDRLKFNAVPLALMLHALVLWRLRRGAVSIGRLAAA